VRGARAAVVVAIALGMPGARAQAPTKSSSQTPILRDDLKANKRTAIDAASDDLDSALDKVLGSSGGFSTAELSKVEDRIRAELKHERPRAAPRFIMFVYPGRITIERLRTMAEVVIDIEVVLDDCERSVCRDAIGSTIELVGRAVGAPEIRGGSYKIRFQSLALQTYTTFRDAELGVYRIPITDCIAATKKKGGGVAWLDEHKRAADDYEPWVSRALVKRAGEKRLTLDGAPKVRRTPTTAEVTLAIKGDRARFKQQVLDAMAAATLALKDNPTTPTEATIEIDVAVPMRTVEHKRFRAPAPQVALWLDGRLQPAALWANYIAEVQQQAGAMQVAFTGDARDDAPDDAPPPDDNEAISVLSSNFNALGQCVRAEAKLRSSFRGVTVTFTWQPNGRASDVKPKEAALRSGPLAGCLKSALELVKLPRFSGAPRTIEYPILIK
jgi:hypothetical protein